MRNVKKNRKKKQTKGVGNIPSLTQMPLLLIGALPQTSGFSRAAALYGNVPQRPFRDIADYMSSF